MTPDYTAYVILSIIVIPVIVVNVARAILINGFAVVNNAKRGFRPEQSVVKDLAVCFVMWPFRRYCGSWPAREELIENLFSLEQNQNITMTEFQGGQFLIDQHVLKAAKIFPTEEAAEEFLRYFSHVNHMLAADHDEHSVDHHEEILMNMVELHAYCNMIANTSSSQGKTSSGNSSERGRKRRALWTESDSSVGHGSKGSSKGDDLQKELKKLRAALKTVAVGTDAESTTEKQNTKNQGDASSTGSQHRKQRTGLDQGSAGSAGPEREANTLDL